MASGDLLEMEHENDPDVCRSIRLIQENAEKIAHLVGEASQMAKAYQNSQDRE